MCIRDRLISEVLSDAFAHQLRTGEMVTPAQAAERWVKQFVASFGSTPSYERALSTEALIDKIAVLVDLLERWSYSLTVEPSPDQRFVDIGFPGCPLRYLADRNPEVALSLHESLLRSALTSLGAAHLEITTERDPATVSYTHLDVYKRQAEVLARPRTGFLADLSGVNLLEGTADPHDPTANGVLVGADRVLGLWEGPEDAVGGQHVMATFAPSAVALFRTPPAGSPRNTWGVRVVDVDPRGATVRVNLTVANGQRLSADLSAPGAAALSLAPGDQLHAQVKATQVFLYPRH